MNRETIIIEEVLDNIHCLNYEPEYHWEEFNHIYWDKNCIGYGDRFKLIEKTLGTVYKEIQKVRMVFQRESDSKFFEYISEINVSEGCGDFSEQSNKMMEVNPFLKTITEYKWEE
ncbi:MAG: hypothetical protein ACRCXT_16340 [Paraclostridium sp.]